MKVRGWLMHHRDQKRLQFLILLPTLIFVSVAKAVEQFDRAAIFMCLLSIATYGAGAMAVLVSRSTDDGRSWRRPVTVAAEDDGRNLDGPAITCDTSSSSRYYGRCYAEFTRLDKPGNSAGKVIQMSVSANGGMRAMLTAPQCSTGTSRRAGTTVCRPAPARRQWGR